MRTATTDSPLLFTFALTNTIADIEGITHIELICQVSPLPETEVRRILYDTVGLKTLPSRAALTRSMIDMTCAALEISPDQFPFGSIPLAPYRLRPEAPEAVAAAASYLPTAIITNTSVFADPGLRPVSDGLHPHLSAIHASWAMGAAKPDPHAFRAAAGYHGLGPHRLIHVGHSWIKDIAPVLALGGRAVWLNPDWSPITSSEPVPPGRLLVATTLTQAVDQAIARWITDTTE